MSERLNPVSNAYAMRLIRVLLVLSAIGPATRASAEIAGATPTVPALWGYGVQTCSAFLATTPGDLIPTALADEDYLRYREWLAGLVTGLNLATGRDVLRDAELDAAMLRIRALCKDHPEDDFFNASLRLVRSLGQLKGK